MKEKKGEILVVLGCLLLITLTVSVAFFMARIEGEGKNIVLKSKDLKITFTESNLLSGTNIEPGWSKTSTFTVKNESKDTYKYNIGIKDLVNTFVTTGYLQYKITSADGGYTMSDYMDIPKSSTAKDKTLAYSIEIASNATQTYTVEFRYQNTTEDQSADMGKTLSGTLYIEAGTDKPTIAERLLDDNPTISTRTDFNDVFTATNTGTLYKATEKNVHNTSDTTVYYFAGDTKNNWVKFGKWETDLIVYRGYYSSSTNSSYREYATIDECASASSFNVNCAAIKFASAGDPIYWRIIRTNANGSVRLLYSGTSPDTTKGHIGISGFNDPYEPVSVGYKYGTNETLDANRTNTTDSAIKTLIDAWYKANLNSYTKYLSAEAVYCNDREIGEGTYSASGNFNFSGFVRLYLNKKPIYDCANVYDAFSVNNSKAKLAYPIGLMTADEVAYAGGTYEEENLNAWYYKNSLGESITGSTIWWLMTPIDAISVIGDIGLFDVETFGKWSAGKLFYESVNAPLGVRPVISLKGNLIWKSGDGSSASPYEVEDLPPTTA